MRTRIHLGDRGRLRRDDAHGTNTADSGAGSLRAAITSAASGDTIAFSDSTSGGATNFYDATARTITLSSGELGLSKDLTIAGPGANVLTVSGNNARRVFNIAAGSYNVTLSALTIANGAVTGANTNIPYLSAGAGHGGAIYNASTATLSIAHCAIVNSRAAGGQSVVTQESRDAGGGPNQGGEAKGGGIYNASTGTVVLTSTTISANAATGGGAINYSSVDSASGGSAYGAGIYNAAGTVRLVNSTLSGNVAEGATADGDTPNGDQGSRHGSGYGAAVYNTSSGTVAVLNTTLVFNKATAPGAFTPQAGNAFGGGIYNANAAAPARVASSIVARNVADTGDAYGAFTSGGYNQIGNGADSSGFTDGSNADRVGTPGATINPNLAGLGYHGGSTQTMPPVWGSVAINAGNAVLTTLSAGIGDTTTTTISVADASTIPARSGFVIQIGSEQMTVVSNSGNTLIVTRAANGTTAAQHNNGAAVNAAFDQRGKARTINGATDTGGGGGELCLSGDSGHTAGRDAQLGRSDRLASNGNGVGHGPARYAGHLYRASGGGEWDVRRDEHEHGYGQH